MLWTQMNHSPLGKQILENDKHISYNSIVIYKYNLITQIEEEYLWKLPFHELDMEAPHVKLL